MTIQIAKTEQLIVGASTTSLIGRYTEASNCEKLTMTLVFIASAGTLAATVSLGSTNDDPLVSSFPALTNGDAIAGLTTGITYAAGVITVASPAAGTYEVTVSYPSFAKWVRPSYVYTSGGGTVDLKVIVSAWSV